MMLDICARILLVLMEWEKCNTAWTLPCLVYFAIHYIYTLVHDSYLPIVIDIITASITL